MVNSHRLDVEMGFHLGQHLFEHQHHEEAFLGPFRRLRVDRHIGTGQREDAVGGNGRPAASATRASGWALSPLMG